MPIHFLNNYPANSLGQSIKKKDGTPLQGEIWLYKQFLNINEYNLLPDETWYLKHDYNLAQHPGSRKKVEGQIDFILLSKYGILVIEVKGGGLRIDENDRYFSGNKSGEYETQNPFNQAKEYIHSLKELIDSSAFAYRAIVLPHEAGFKLDGPQLNGYQDLFFSKRDFGHLNEDSQDRAITNLFFNFINELAKSSRRKIINELNPGWSLEKTNNNLFVKYPELKSKQVKRLKSELFPSTTSYGYNPDRINKEIILEENYEILKSLKRNQRILVQGAPGTGKTVLAIKFLAENLLKQHKGIMYCANKLVRSKLEHIIINDYDLDSNSISFRIFSDNTTIDKISTDIDFIVFDEAQEYFDKGLYDFTEELNRKLDKPKMIILYDPKQSIISDFKDLNWYTDYFIESGHTHYLFDEVYRCIQNEAILNISNLILSGDVNKLQTNHSESLLKVDTVESKLKMIHNIIKDIRFTKTEKIILVHSDVIEIFKEIVGDYFNAELEELTDQNINVGSSKIRYTTPLKYKGLENKAMYLITNGLDEKSKVQNYVAITRAMESIKIATWQN